MDVRERVLDSPDRELVLDVLHDSRFSDYAAGELAIFRRVRLPNALPYIFSALKVASVLAMIGAVVGEYFGGSVEALGVQIRNSAALFAFETAWAAILVASILGICFYLTIALLERLMMGWHASARTVE